MSVFCLHHGVDPSKLREIVSLLQRLRGRDFRCVSSVLGVFGLSVVVEIVELKERRFAVVELIEVVFFFVDGEVIVTRMMKCGMRQCWSYLEF